MKTISSVAVCAAAALMYGSAGAHVVLEKKSTEAGTAFKAAFVVGHGCDGSPTTGITVKIPDGFRGVKPVPKPGWTLETRKVPLDKPYESHGRKITERVSEVTWKSGKLDAEHYDEFVVVMQAPEAAGKKYFAVSQRCESGSMDWAEIPAAGKSRRDYKMPAAELEVLPVGKAAALEGHKH